MNVVGREREVHDLVLSAPTSIENAKLLRQGDFTGIHMQVWTEKMAL